MSLKEDLLTNEFLQNFLISLLENSCEEERSDPTEQFDETQQDQDYSFGPSQVHPLFMLSPCPNSPESLRNLVNKFTI